MNVKTVTALVIAMFATISLPSRSSALAAVFMGKYVRASGGAYAVDESQSMLGVINLSTVQFQTGAYKAHIEIDTTNFYGDTTGILLNTVGGDESRCTLMNQLETFTTPKRLTFDVYCVMPLPSGAWTYTMSDFQFVVYRTYNTDYQTSYAFVNADGTYSSASRFTQLGSGFTVSRSGWKSIRVL